MIKTFFKVASSVVVGVLLLSFFISSITQAAIPASWFQTSSTTGQIIPTPVSGGTYPTIIVTLIHATTTNGTNIFDGLLTAQQVKSGGSLGYGFTNEVNANWLLTNDNSGNTLQLYDNAYSAHIQNGGDFTWQADSGGRFNVAQITRVGVGTTTGTAQLTIQSSSNRDLLTIASSTGKRFARITPAGALILGETGQDILSQTPTLLTLNADSGSSLYNLGDAAITLNATADDNAGNAYIKTTKAGLALNYSGLISTNNKAPDNTTYTDTLASSYLIGNKSGIGSLQFGVMDAVGMTLNNVGLQIGTTTSANKLTVQGTSGSSVNLFNVASSTGTSNLLITSGGNVGIGTSTPIGNLDVKGGIYSETANPATSTSMTIDFSTANNSQTLKISSSNIAVTFTNASLVVGKNIMLNIVAPLSGAIGSTTFSGGSGSGAIVWNGGISPGNSIVNGTTDTFCFTSVASSTNFIASSLCGNF